MALDLNIPVGGRLSLFSKDWHKWCQDKWALEIVSQGYLIPFLKIPPFKGVKHTPLSGQYAGVLLEEVDSLLSKGAIECVTHQFREGFFSTYFLVPKKTGDLRPILNLKPINGLIQSPTFKMETLQSVLRGVFPGDWIPSLDLKDAYFHVPIHPDHRKFLRFCIQDKCFQYKVLPFGLTTSPRVFTKILTPIMARLRLHGVKAFPYLDDILFTAESKQAVEAHLKLAISALTQAGFMINVKKSSLVPAQDMVFLGARIQSDMDLVRLPLEKALSLQGLVLTFREKANVPARRWLVLLGVMASVLPMIS